MKRLVIDTATPACSVALFDDDVLIAGEYLEIGRGHAERLVPLIQGLPGNGRADAVHVNTGPGSFTGVRVGISAARALALAWDVECFGYNCLQLVAAMSGAKGPVDVAMQGGHGEFFFQPFDADLKPLDPAASLTPAAAAAVSNARVIAGNAADILASLLPGREVMNLLPDARKWHLLINTETQSTNATYIRDADAIVSSTSK
jgi:tRNA threonylcarbamoyl adenosine modification protein YeaZ